MKMKKLVIFGMMIGVLAVLSPSDGRGEAEGEGVGELTRKAYLLDREARRAIHGEDLRAAYDALRSAAVVYGEIARIYPEWRPESVRSRITALNTEAEGIGRKIFALPRGTVGIEAGMVREGQRYNAGRAIAGKVTPAGEAGFEVESFMVTLVRTGPLLGATCACPDFTYRGSKHGFACKHIWAVVHHEKLLP